MDYRNICYFVIFVLSFFCYDLYNKNKDLQKLCIEQDKAIKELQSALMITTGTYYYLEPQKKKNSPVH